jgi:hypothetical protein
MSIAEMNPLEHFQWERQPLAEQLVRGWVDQFLTRVPEAAELARRLLHEASVRFVDLADMILLHKGDVDAMQLEQAGWTRRSDDSSYLLLDNELGMFPTLALSDLHPAGVVQVHMKVEFVADFLAAQGLRREIVGRPLAPYRFAEIYRDGDWVLGACERHGHRGLATTAGPTAEAVLATYESFRHRPRDVDEAEGFCGAHELVDCAIGAVGRDYACDLFFAAEREYWQRRNRAAQVQKYRQDKLGIGWANHDHHTYRSSREQFKHLVSVWEKLGLFCRERFYAGREAGWGAQVMEQPVTGIITFNDVDLSPEELMGDFSHDGLEPRERLGTVGLWCALHGEAFLQAGMHHLEGQFDFDGLREQLEREGGVKTMKPFTDFSYLRQAFTEGERWPVRPQRIERALVMGYITAEQAQQFREQGAIGSHLENLERNEGFKGFNQTGVSEIIAATDPRKQVTALRA